ncbi:MAG: class I SAM-dependent methyltransferase [Variovorax sp.]
MTQERDGYFDAMYGASNDPYGLRTRWYEERKRAVLLAALPARRYRRAYEPGCGAGELTIGLAARCDAVFASDASQRAVAIAQERNRGLHNVRIEQQVLPGDWPRENGGFDLIVLSELGYFLDEAAMREVASGCARSLDADGTLVACDWLPDFPQRAMPTRDVHAALVGIGLARIARHEEDDFLLQVWSRDARPVAVREGIR